MKIQSANFVISHKHRLYSVDFLVQDTDQNRRRAIVKVEDIKERKTLINLSMSGRQLICPENAKLAIKEAIKDQPHEKSSNKA